MDYSLPYCTTIDQTHEDYEQYGLSLIEDEMKQINPRPLDRDMKELKYRTSLMKKEYTTLFQPTTTDGQGGGNDNDDDETENLTYVPRENVSLADFDTSPPPKRPKLGKSKDAGSEDDAIIKEWKLQALSYARSKYEAERIRSINLDVEKHVSSGGSSKNTPSNWKQYIEQTLHDMDVQYQSKLQRQRDSVDEINYQRQSSQERMYGPQLEQYMSEYQQLLFKRNTLEYNIYKKNENNNSE